MYDQVGMGSIIVSGKKICILLNILSGGYRKEGKKVCLAENRTQAAHVAGEHSTTESPILW